MSYSSELQKLIFCLARDILVNTYGFPKSLLDCNFDSSFAVRGLSVDLQSGVLCKLSHLQRIGLHSSYRGKKPLSQWQIEKIYGESRFIHHGDMVKLRPLNDLYSIAEACLIADATEVFHSSNQSDGIDYRNIVDDVQVTNQLRDNILQQIFN